MPTLKNIDYSFKTPANQIKKSTDCMNNSMNAYLPLPKFIFSNANWLKNIKVYF